MNDTLLLELLKIVKKSKNLVIKSFEEEGFSASFIDFESTYKELEEQTERLASAIKSEAPNFDKNYKNEDELKKAISKSFEHINTELKKVIAIYLETKGLHVEDNIETTLSLLFVKKILLDYVLWCDNLENAFLGISSENVIFKPSIKLESKILNFIVENIDKKSTSCMLPFLGGIGLGFLLDGE